MAISAYYHATPAGAGLKDGSDWDNAFGEPELETHLETNALAGDVCFLMEGTYTLDSSILGYNRDGDVSNPIAIIGVKSSTTNTGASIVYTDWAVDDADMPFIDCGAFQFGVGQFTRVHNLYFQGNVTNMVYGDSHSVFFNCRFENDGDVSNANYLLYFVAYGRAIDCEFTAPNGTGVNCGAGCVFINNYFHDISGTGYAVTLNNAGNFCSFNTFDNCVRGITANSYHNVVENNTFYGCGTGVYGDSCYDYVGINNIVEGTTTDGFKFAQQYDGNLHWGNHGDDVRCTDMWDGVDATTVFQDYAVTTGDPLFTTAGSDFSLQTGSPCINTGLSISRGI